MRSETAARLERGRSLFNTGRYFEAHEVWEEAWLGEAGKTRTLLQGLIQITAALHKASRGERPRGCLLLLDWGIAKLDAVADSSHGLALGPFRSSLAVFRRRARRWLDGKSGAPLTGVFPRLARAGRRSAEQKRRFLNRRQSGRGARSLPR